MSSKNKIYVLYSPTGTISPRIYKSKSTIRKYVKEDPNLSYNQFITMNEAEEFITTSNQIGKMKMQQQENIQKHLNKIQEQIEEKKKINQQIVNYVRQGKCHNYRKQINSEYWATIQRVIPATYMFASEEHGTAVCISKDGLIITCHHCIEEGGQFPLISFDGTIYQAKILYSNEKLDLALLKINPQKQLEFVQIWGTKCEEKQIAFCIGNPGFQNLQSQKPKRTHYRPFHVSRGRIEGYLKDQIYGNTKRGLGPLKHNCWTYWGHSGAPIFNVRAELIGIHNSWDDRDATRHGLSARSINKILQQFVQKGGKL